MTSRVLLSSFMFEMFFAVLALFAHQRTGVEQTAIRSSISNVLQPIDIMVFVIRWLQEFARKKRTMVCFIDLANAYDSVDQTLV